MKKKLNDIIDMIQGVILFGAFLSVIIALAPIKVFIAYVAILGAAAAGSGIIRGAINDR